VNPPRVLRSKRDPYGDWWDKQDRRNYGEPAHEDHDILGPLSLHDYDHFAPGWGGVLLGTFCVAVAGLCWGVSYIYPDKISVPKTYEGGLEAELGGPAAVRVSVCEYSLGSLTDRRRREWRATSSTRNERVISVYNISNDISFVQSWLLYQCGEQYLLLTV
jgi:hypothetical protein